MKIKSYLGKPLRIAKQNRFEKQPERKQHYFQMSKNKIDR